MEKKKPTIDEIYKLNVDGLFESTANWFDNAFKKSQAEINRDLYNKINGYSSSSESTGGNVSLGPLLTSLNGSNLYPSRGYLYYNGNDWEFNTPTISGGEGGGVVDTAAITKIVNDTIKNVSWWGQKINNNKVNGSITITKGSHSFTIELDDNGNLKFNGNIYATGGITALGVGTITGGGNGVSLGTLLTKLNSDNPFPTTNGQVLTYNGSNFVWKTPTGGSGVALSPVMNAMNNQLGKTTFNTPQFLYWDGSTYTWKNESEISGGSGSSSRINYITLFNSRGESFETIDLGTADTIGFMQGDNITFQSVVKNFTNVIKISATCGSSGGSSVGSISWTDVTNKPSTFTPSSHTHSASDISGLSGVKVNNAINADRLLNSRTIWGQSFNGTSDINGNLKMGTAGGGSIQLWMNNGNMLDRTNNTLHIGNGLKQYSNGEINFDAYKTVVYTDNIRNHYDFKSNVFDVNSNQIHFGSETNGGKIYWDAANNAFKIEGNVYATGGITALGVSNSATTSNNVDFTFNSVTSKRNIIYAVDNVPFKIYPKNNTNTPLIFSHNGVNWNIYDDDTNDIHLQRFCKIDSDGWVFSPKFHSNENGRMSLDGSSFYLGDTNNNVNVVFTYNGSKYRLDMSRAISVGVFTMLSTQELSALQERNTNKKAVL